MSKLSLRDYQRTLSARLVDRAGEQPVSLLGVQAGTGRWLVDLADAGEVIPVPPVSRVPLMRSWLAGLANVRGNLYTVIDFSAFLGGTPAASGDAARLLLIAEKHRINCGLLVDRVYGLYRREQLVSAGDARSCAWSAGAQKDAQGNAWQKLDLSSLLADAAFLNVAA